MRKNHTRINAQESNTNESQRITHELMRENHTRINAQESHSNDWAWITHEQVRRNHTQSIRSEHINNLELISQSDTFLPQWIFFLQSIHQLLNGVLNQTRLLLLFIQQRLK